MNTQEHLDAFCRKLAEDFKIPKNFCSAIALCIAKKACVRGASAIVSRAAHTNSLIPPSFAGTT